MGLFRSSILIGISTIIKMLAGLITTKIIAVFIGPVGVAILGNFVNFTGIISTFGNGAVGSGVTKYISEYNKVEDKRIVVSHAIKISLFCSFVLSVFVILFSGFLSDLILKSKEYQAIFIVFGASIIFYGLNLTASAILCGYQKTGGIIISGMLSNIVGVVLAALITIRFGLFGALINSVVLQVVTFFIYILFIFRAKLFDIAIMHIKLNKKLLKKLLKYAVMSIVASLAIPISTILIRSYVINYYSTTEAGFLQGVWNISNVYLSIIITILSTYFMPIISNIKEEDKLRLELMHTFKIILTLSFLGLIVVFISQDIIIRLLYTNEFDPMKKYFTFHIVGDFLRISSLILEYVLVAKAMARWHVTFSITTSVLYIVLSFASMRIFGVIGETYAYCMNYFIYLVALIILFKNILFKQSKQ